MKLRESGAITPYGNEYGSVVVVAETREEEIRKATLKMRSSQSNYAPERKYVAELSEHLDSMMFEIEEGVRVDFGDMRVSK